MALISSINDFKNQLNYEIKCFYVIDDSVRYVAVSLNNEYVLYSVYDNTYDSEIMHSLLLGEFDSYIYTNSKPIKSQACGFTNYKGDVVRILNTITANYFERSTLKKKKPKEERNIIVVSSNNSKKLF